MSKRNRMHRVVAAALAAGAVALTMAAASRSAARATVGESPWGDADEIGRLVPMAPRGGRSS